MTSSHAATNYRLRRTTTRYNYSPRDQRPANAVPRLRRRDMSTLRPTEQTTVEWNQWIMARLIPITEFEVGRLGA